MTQHDRAWGRRETIRYLAAHITVSLMLWDGIVRERRFALVLGYLAMTFILCHALWTAERLARCADVREADEGEVDKGER